MELPCATARLATMPGNERQHGGLKCCDVGKTKAVREIISHRFFDFILRKRTRAIGASAIDLEQPGAALPAADAHRDDAPLRLAAAAFLQDVAGQAGAGHAEGM